MKPFKALLDFFKTIINIGVDKDKEQESHYLLLIQVVNLILILASITALINILMRIVLMNNDFYKYINILILFLLGVLGLYLNGKRYYDGATAVATIGLTTFMMFNVYYYEITTSRADLVFLPIAVAAPLTFRRKWLGIGVFIGLKKRSKTSYFSTINSF